MAYLQKITGNFSDRYFLLRKKENRIYSNEEVAQLPIIRKNHPHHKEWQIRKDSCVKLINYIKQKGYADILEVGCGNGWLSAQLACVTKGNVLGLDTSLNELEQARSVFMNFPNLSFLEANFQSDPLGDQKFDIIVFAASIQYFSSIKQIVDIAFNHLTLRGEIHFLDTIFYPEKKIKDAEKRTKEYYQFIGYPEMANYYFHHCLTSLSSYQFKIKRDPHSLSNKLSLGKSPFYWIIIKNRYHA